MTTCTVTCPYCKATDVNTEFVNPVYKDGTLVAHAIGLMKEHKHKRKPKECSPPQVLLMLAPVFEENILKEWRITSAGRIPAQ